MRFCVQDLSCKSKEKTKYNTEGTVMTLSQRLRLAMEKHALSVAELSRRADVPSYFLHDILNEKSSNPAPSRLSKVAEQLNVTLEYLIGVTDAPAISPLAHIPLLRVGSKQSKKRAELIDAPHEGGLAFQREWIINRLKAVPENLRLVMIETDHMLPTLQRHDQVLIDMSRTTPSPLGMFVIFDGMGLSVQRLERLGKNDLIRISCDNPAYSHKDIPQNQLDIIGRVVWYAHEM
jgi:transcriptional regulator with XRE-family HTH domain